MRVWRRPNQPTVSSGAVTRAALAGAAIQELARQAVQVLLANELVDRAGVWLESDETDIAPNHEPVAFRGIVANADGSANPAEWNRWSPEASWPNESLIGGKSIVQELDDQASRAVIGPLVELRRALWVPLQDLGRLRGMLFAGTRKKQTLLPETVLQSVAAELALALELEDQRRLARERCIDLAAIRQFLAALASGQSTHTLLQKLSEDCTRTNHFEVGAVFAAIAQASFQLATEEESVGAQRLEASDITSTRRPLDGSLEQSAKSSQRRENAINYFQFCWRSGTPAWTHAIKSEPLSGVWRRAIETHRTVGSDLGVSWSRGEVARIIAIPLRASGETLGVLVAGLRSGAASLRNLERLEQRAALATSALLHHRHKDEMGRQFTWLRALLRDSGQATILVDPRGVITGISAGAAKLLGEPELDWKADHSGPGLSRTFPELFRLPERSGISEWLKHALVDSQSINGAGQDPREAELYNGVEVRVRSLLPPGANVVAARLEPLHVTEAGRGRADAEVQLLSLIEWLEEGVLLFDEHGDLRVINSRFAQLSGLAPEDASQISSLEALIVRLSGQVAEPGIFAERWRALARGEGAVGVREEIHLLQPVPRVLERAARSVLGSRGQKLGRIEIYRDLTAQRVFQSKLLQTEKLAALGQMMTNVAHELSNPLTSILGYAQRLLLRGDLPKGAEEAGQIFQEAERASTILKQLLVTARESPASRNRVALNEVVSRTMELQRFSLAAEKVRVELNLDPTLPHVIGDAGQLQQVLMNLMGNARQAIGQQGHGGTIWLSTRGTDRDRVLLEVRDDGPGIPKAILARIFDPFFTTKPAGIGTGLGLPIVLGIVREHGGQVNVSSPAQGGALFTLDFPAASAQQSGRTGLPATGPGLKTAYLPSRRIVASRSQPVTSAAPRRGRVLVVEDEPTVARLIGDVLEDDGFSVDVLLDGRRALKRAASESYDLVICDMKMPGLDGQHFYKTLVRTGNPLREKFLFVTGDVVAAQTQEFLERNSLPHVAKPFRMEELIEKVRDVLQSQLVRQRAKTQKSTAARK